MPKMYILGVYELKIQTNVKKYYEKQKPIVLNTN